MNVLQNRREFTRVTVAIHAELRVGGNVVIRGKLQNVSFNGLLIQSHVSLTMHTPCSIFLCLDGGNGGPVIEAKGCVIRSQGDALGVQFTEIVGEDSATHLQNLLIYNSGSQVDIVEGELDATYGLLSKS